MDQHAGEGVRDAAALALLQLRKNNKNVKKKNFLKKKRERRTRVSRSCTSSLDAASVGCAAASTFGRASPAARAALSAPPPAPHAATMRATALCSAAASVTRGATEPTSSNSPAFTRSWG